jgi:urocanate hydratase
MGGAQPLAATMNGACFLGIDVDPQRIETALATGYCDRMATNLDDALAFCARRRLREASALGGARGNCADVLPELVRRGVVPDVLTDQTSAHDPLNGYVPNGVTLEEARRPARERSRRLPGALVSQHGRACGGHAGAAKAGRGDLRLRQQHPHPGQAKAGVENAYDIPGFVPEYIRPLFCEGRGPFRWVALSGDPQDIYRTDRLALELFPHNETLARWIPWRASASISRAARRASAGWGTASAPNSEWPSTGWCGRANCKRPSSSGAIIWTPARWRRPIARRKPCATAPTPSPTGRCSTRW